MTALLTSAPAFAGDQDRRGSRGDAKSKGSQTQSTAHVGGRAVERAVPRQEAAAPVAVAPRVVRPEVVRPSAVGPGVVASGRSYDSRSYVASGYGARPYVAHPYYAPRPYYAYPYYARPYYTGPYVFRPHFSVGFGIYAGYPVPYAYAYPYSVPVYGYGAPSSTVIVGSNSTRYGGVALEITPGEASVYVDGGYAGLVRDFDGTQRTLTLATGRHRIEISAPGFEPMTLDVDTVPGQIVPYRGDLQPLR